jgi:hypothetical protein
MQAQAQPKSTATRQDGWWHCAADDRRAGIKCATIGGKHDYRCVPSAERFTERSRSQPEGNRPWGRPAGQTIDRLSNAFTSSSFGFRSFEPISAFPASREGNLPTTAEDAVNFCQLSSYFWLLASKHAEPFSAWHIVCFTSRVV